MKRIYFYNTNPLHESAFRLLDKTLHDLPLGDYVITITPNRKTRSNQQNAYLWGIVYPAVLFGLRRRMGNNRRRTSTRVLQTSIRSPRGHQQGHWRGAKLTQQHGTNADGRVQRLCGQNQGFCPRISQPHNSRTQRRMKDLEHRLQCACVRWFAYQHPELKGTLFAVPNGGSATR